MKVRITEDEWFPFYLPTNDEHRAPYEIEVKPATLKRWHKVLKANSRVQGEIRAAIKGQGLA